MTYCCVRSVTIGDMQVGAMEVRATSSSAAVVLSYLACWFLSHPVVSGKCHKWYKYQVEGGFF